MVEHQVPRKQAGIVLLVVVSLLAQLIPTTSLSLFAQSPQCGEAGEGSVTTAAVAVPDADQEVPVPEDIVDLAVYTANWRYRLKNSAYVEGLVFDLFLLNTDKTQATDLLDA